MILYQTRRTDGFQVKDVASMEIGDVFEFTLKDGKAVRAMAVKKDEEATDFITVDCLEGKGMAMNLEPMSEGGYDESDLRESLNQEILALFPDDIREAMVPVYRDDLLTIPSEMEIFGERIFSKEDSKDEQLEPMKENRNRIALDGMDGYPNWYWLRDAAYAYDFALVNLYGIASRSTATYSFGIRPRFRIANR